MTGLIPEPQLFVAFLLAAAVICLTPGPNMALVMSFGLARGWRAGLAAAVGMAVSTLAGTTLTAYGWTALLVSHPRVFVGVKVVGIAYLVHLGLGFLRDRTPLTVDVPRRERMAWRIALQAMVVNGTNPSVVLFVVAFLPQFASASGPVRPQILLLGLVFVALGFVADASVGMASGRLRERLVARPELSRRINVVSGSVMCALAGLVATTIAG